MHEPPSNELIDSEDPPLKRTRKVWNSLNGQRNLIIVKRLKYRSTIAQMADRATWDWKVPGSIPAWIQWDFASKYTACLFCIFMADGYDIWYDCIHQESALELQSRAAPNMEAHHRVNGPDTERNFGGRRIINKKRLKSLKLSKSGKSFLHQLI